MLSLPAQLCASTRECHDYSTTSKPACSESACANVQTPTQMQSVNCKYADTEGKLMVLCLCVCVWEGGGISERNRIQPLQRQWAVSEHQCTHLHPCNLKHRPAPFDLHSAPHKHESDLLMLLHTWWRQAFMEGSKGQIREENISGDE